MFALIIRARETTNTKAKAFQGKKKYKQGNTRNYKSAHRINESAACKMLRFKSVSWGGDLHLFKSMKNVKLLQKKGEGNFEEIEIQNMDLFKTPCIAVFGT